MPPVNHSLLGASKAHQWLECPPSARWELEFPEPPESEAAAEGTLAHAIAEEHLRKRIAGKAWRSTPKKWRTDPLYRPAMEEHVATYCDTVMEVLTALREKGDPFIELEQKLDLTPWIPEGFGTADCIIISDGVLHVFDLKYGKGIPVHAEENPQLKLYALGAMAEYEWAFDIREATLHIVQPRLDSITEWTVSAEVLKKWGEFVVKPIAQKAYKGEGEYNPGEAQCRWCRCKDRCRAYNNYLLEVCKLRFDDLDVERNPNELSDEEIAKFLDMADEIKRWCTRVSEYALDQALNFGKTFPGYKVVEGLSRRKIVDEDKVITILDEHGYQMDKICKLKGIGDLEDLVGKKELQNLIGDYIQKPPGKPTLAPESDTRKTYTDIKFTEIKENEES